MTKDVVMPVALCVLVLLQLFHDVNAGAIVVQSSASSFSGTNCDGMNCPSGHSCSVSFSGIGDNSTKVKFCTDFAGNSHREEIVTVLVGNQECITNTTDINGNVTTTKHCTELSPKELKHRQEEWEQNVNIVTEEDEKLNSLLESQHLAWERHREAMDRVYEEHEKAMEQAMLQREKMWKMHEDAMDREFERLADFEI